MKRMILLLFISLPLWSMGQYYSYEDFESYTPGLFVTQWDSTDWDHSCIKAPLYDPKATITDTFAFNGNQCLDLMVAEVGNRNVNCKRLYRDVPVPIGGTIKISYRMYRPAGREFRVVFERFAWAEALDLLYEDEEVEVASNNNSFSEYYTSSTDAWHLIEVLINYDTDSVSHYQNGVHLTTRYFGEAAIAYVDKIHFWAFFEDLGAYIDDLKIEQYLVSTEQAYQSINDFRVYPNPTQGQLTIALNLKRAADVQYQLVDIQGRLLEEWTETSVTNTRRQKDVSHLANGMYFLQIRTGGEVETRKVVVSR